MVRFFYVLLRTRRVLSVANPIQDLQPKSAAGFSRGKARELMKGRNRQLNLTQRKKSEGNIPWQQFFPVIRFIHEWSFLKNASQVVVRVHIILFGCLNQ